MGRASGHKIPTVNNADLHHLETVSPVLADEISLRGKRTQADATWFLARAGTRPKFLRQIHTRLDDLPGPGPGPAWVCPGLCCRLRNELLSPLQPSMSPGPCRVRMQVDPLPG